MSTSAYQDLLVELGRDLEHSEAEEFELRRLERYLIRKLADDGSAGSNGRAPSSPREDERRLDLLDGVRRELVDVERALDELRILDTRVRRLSARQVSNGEPAAPKAAPADPLADAAGPAQPAGGPTAPAAAPVPAAGFAIDDLLARAVAVPVTTRGRFAPAAAEREGAACTLFTPPQIAIGGEVPLFVLCRPETRAADGSPEQKRRGGDSSGSADDAGSLGTRLVRDSRLAFELCVHGLEVQPPRRELIWTSCAQLAEFRVQVPDSIRAGSAIGKLSVVQDGVPIGRLRFQWRLMREPGDIGLPLEPLGRPQRYERAYLCYAPRDRHEVQHRARMLADAGIEAVEGNLDLDASQRWARGVYRQIDACDVLFLFWSPAAAESAWVQKEWQYGLKRRGADFVRLIVLEGAVPGALAFLQTHGPAGQVS